MNLSAPKERTFLIAAILFIVGLVLALVNIAGLSDLVTVGQFATGELLVVLSFIVLAAANMINGF